MSRSSYNFSINGSEGVICGTLKGKSAKFKLAEATMSTALNATRSTVVGALNGGSNIYMSKARFVADSSGRNALLFGGFSDDDKILLKNMDIKTELVTEQGRDSFASDEDFVIINGRSDFSINREPIERKVIIDANEYS